MMVERRRYPRFELKVEAKYRILDSEEIMERGLIRNISAEGLCFEADERLGIGAIVELEVDLKDSMPPVRLIGEIRWSHEANQSMKGTSGQYRFLNGIKLVNIARSDEARFLKYYCDRIVQMLLEYLKK